MFIGVGGVGMKMRIPAGVGGVWDEDDNSCWCFGGEGNLLTIYIYMTFIYMFCWFLKRLA